MHLEEVCVGPHNNLKTIADICFLFDRFEKNLGQIRMSRSFCRGL